MTDAQGSSGEDRVPGLRPRRLDENITGAPETTGRRGAAALRQRCAGLLTSAWSRVRPTRRRTTGYIAICAVGGLLGTSVVVGAGKAGAVPDLSDIGAWLTSSRTGEAAHANGLTGDVDGKVKLPGMSDHPVSVSQNGKTILVLDKKTGKLVRIDPSQLTAEQSSRYGAGGLQLVTGGKYAYLVDPVKATVQRIDPVRTTPVGRAVDLGDGPLGRAVADRKGTLWVPVPTQGKAVPFPRGKKAKGIGVGKKSDRASSLMMSLADGRPLVTDTKGGTVTLLSRAGQGMRFKLPGSITKAPAGTVLVPKSTAGDVVPVLARETGRMTLVNTRTGSLLSASLGTSRDEYGTPQVLGSKVYVPDNSDGTLKVYDTEAAAIEKPVTVTGKRGRLGLFVRDGLLWVNDQNNETAMVINSRGDINRVRKYRSDVPSGRKPGENPSADPSTSAPGANVPAPGGSGGGGTGGSGGAPSGPSGKQPEPGGKKPGRTPKPPKNTTKPGKPGDDPPEPQAPGTPQAQSGAGTITVSFSPSPGAKPSGYRLKGAPEGAEVKPGKVGAEGPFTFEVKGGSCDQQYSFTVVAEFEGGRTVGSGPSGPTRPCVAPGAPQNITSTIPDGGHGVDLKWDKPENAGDNGTTYTVTGAGNPAPPPGPDTSAAVRGMANSQKYNITVAATNAAGSGGSAVTTVDLAPPPRQMAIADNDDDGKGVGVRSQASSTAGERVAKIPSGETPGIKVLCQVRGTAQTHDTRGWNSDVWDRVEWDGRIAYISDLWLNTSNKTRGDWSPEVWQCD